MSFNLIFCIKNFLCKLFPFLYFKEPIRKCSALVQDVLVEGEEKKFSVPTTNTINLSTTNLTIPPSTTVNQQPSSTKWRPNGGCDDINGGSATVGSAAFSPGGETADYSAMVELHSVVGDDEVVEHEDSGDNVVQQLQVNKIVYQNC